MAFDITANSGTGFDITLSSAVSHAIQKTIEYHIVGETTMTYEDSATLPTDDADLANSYSGSDITAVATDDNSYKDLTGADYLIEQRRVLNNNDTANITATWKGKSSLAPTSSTIYLQIYNYNTPAWETLDSDSSTAVNTEFTLTGSITANQSNYYDADNYYVIRVYQQVS